MHKISQSEHAKYSVVLPTQMFQGGRSNLREIKFILRKAAKHGSDGARYFLMMLLSYSKMDLLSRMPFLSSKTYSTDDNWPTAKEPS